MKNKEPLFHIVKRPALKFYQSLGIRLIAIFLALVLSGIITMLLTGLNPLDVYKTIFEGALGTKRRIWTTAQNLSILLLISLAVTPAFRMKFWNIGAEGQVLMGALASASCMILLGGKIPNVLLIILMFILSMVAGAIWGWIPAVCKAHWNTNETLSTLMLNYIATQLVAFFVVLWETPAGSGNIGVINSFNNEGWFPSIAGQKYLMNIIIVAVVLGLLYFYLNYTKHGYEISVVGESIRTAQYIGITTKRVIIRTMMLSGAICGLAGLLLVAGTHHTLTTSLAGGQGFTAVLVSWMAKFNPITMILTSFLIIFLQQGGGQISTVFGLNGSFPDILTGIILFFIIGSEFFIRYKLSFKTNKKEG